MELPADTVVAYRYCVRGLLGIGGAAHTYAAADLVEGGEVALKVLSRDRPHDELRLEFERLRGVVHPHLLAVRDFGFARIAGVRRAFYTAERINGPSLRAALSGDLKRLAAVAGDVLEALHVLHQLGLRHGDVKPENVLLDARERGVLIDLGCAAPLGSASSALSGTPGYLAPELEQGRAADERADLFAFGVMLRELGADGALAPLIARLTAARPEERPSSAREVLELLGDRRDVDRRVLGRARRMVGREADERRLSEWLIAAARGEGAARCVWIEAAPGLGRSRLLRELGYALVQSGVDVLEASAREPTPLRSALGRLHGAFEPGFEALLEQLAAAASSREGRVVVLDDGERLGAEAREELSFALRALGRDARFAVLIASRDKPPAHFGALHHALAPLSEAALSEWARELVLPEHIAALARYTGGSPRYVERTLEALAEGRLRAAELAHATAELDAASVRALELALDGLAREERRLLGEVALGVRVRASADSLRLLARGLLCERGGELALARDADREALLARLDGELVRALRLEAARRLAADAAPEAAALAIHHFMQSNCTSDAIALFEARKSDAALAPRAFVAQVAPLAAALTPSLQVELARAARLAGDAPAALGLLARARRARCETALYREAAEVYLALGRAARARLMLERGKDCDDPLWLELAARMSVRDGDYTRALELAGRGLERASERPLSARLLETRALASAYLGDDALAASSLEAALPLHAPDDARSLARHLALRGFVSMRAGRAQEAAEAYGEAFAAAERAGLSDLVVNALINLAVARQALGLWGAALRTYERALTLAEALGRAASARSVRLNLANVALEIGSFERAHRELDALERSDDSAALASSVRLYRAELALLEGDAERALEVLAALDSRAPLRERVEARALALLAAEARRDSPRIEAALPELPAERDLPLDVRARAAEARSRALRSVGRAKEAFAAIEAFAPLLRTLDPALAARLEGELADSAKALAAEALAAEHARRARARWERIALDLPPTLREAFWAHPLRRALAERPPDSAPPSRTTLSLARVRELNRRISALHTPEEVLEFALDAAIELTGAERGFLLLVRERGFEVAAAHGMDRTRAPKSEWKWSRSIAERVIRDGQPVLTVDAGRDPRFARQASVHALQLKSVLCAPIRTKQRVEGALYLDNRLARARFAEQDAELLLTFADQVAIALRHAELVRELESRARELAREKRKVEELARGQAREIERLEQELTNERAAQSMRYEYREIVGRSEPMRRVLAVLDRVIDSDLSVLVQGESGTGKELVARAIHAHGPRRDRPFVSVNCAALPETLLESELFGHVKGAFTGALSAREGLFVRARGGTLFLDELAELPLAMQAKLLRALNDGEVRPVGSSKSFSVDVRLVCATNKGLKQCVESGSFREDLYYRVSVVELTLPALRERHEDIVPIAEALLAERARATGAKPLTLTPEAVRALLAHAWPGNVRELHNVLLRASVMASGGVIRASDLELPSHDRLPAIHERPTNRGEYARKEAERLLSALEAERWNVSKVAKNLGIPRNTLYRKLARYGIERG